jgi:O-antigen/teichoic acid export membrane protein
MASLSAVIGHLGIGQVVAINHRDGLAQAHRTLLLLTLVASALGFGTCSAFMAWSVPDFSIAQHLAASSCAAALAVQTLLLGVSQHDPQLRVHNALRSWPPLVALLAYAGLVLEKQGAPESFLGAQAVAVGLVVALLGPACAKGAEGKGVGSGLSIADWRMAGGFLSIAIVGAAVNNFEKLYFIFEPDMEEFGIYSVAFGTSRLILLVQSSASTPLFSRYAGTGDVTGSIAAVRQALRLTAPPLLLVAIVLAVFSEPLMVAIYGSQFSASAVPFALLAVEAVFSGSAWLLAQHFTAHGRPWVTLARQTVSLVPLILTMVWMPFDRTSVSLAAGMLASGVFRAVITFLLVQKDARKGVNA